MKEALRVICEEKNDSLKYQQVVLKDRVALNFAELDYIRINRTEVLEHEKNYQNFGIGGLVCICGYFACR